MPTVDFQQDLLRLVQTRANEAPLANLTSVTAPTQNEAARTDTVAGLSRGDTQLRGATPCSPCGSRSV